MNYFFVFRQLSRLLASLSLILLGLAGWSALLWALGEQAEQAAAEAFALAGAGGLSIGMAGWAVTRRGRTDLERREALLLVTLSWVFGALLSATPYFLWAQFTAAATTPAEAFASPVNCYFEAMSGLTTTGATILSGIETLPRSVLLWRAITHWIGGLGIVVLFVAVLPSVGAAGKRMFTVESAGPSPKGVRPEVRETARVLLIIYSALTVALIVLLRIFGMNWFDSVCHAFATLATGGFSTRDASVGGWPGAAVQWILLVFMILGGVNFGLYYQGVRRRSFAAVFRDTELRVYLITILLVTALCFALLLGRPIATTQPDGAGGLVEHTGALNTLRHAAFQSASIHTTTGFCTADFNLWPTLATGAIVLLMFVGGCAGSTAGGIKVIRLWIALRLALAQVERTFRPSVVRPLRVGRQVVSDEIKLDTLAYILAFILIWLIGTGILLGIEAGGEISFATAATASVSALGTIGPGLARVGAVQNYAWMTDASKALLCVWMLLARLEIFPVIVLLSLRFWRE